MARSWPQPARTPRSCTGTQLIGPGKISTRLWDLSTGRERARFPLAGPLTFSPDGKLLAVAVTDGTVRLYDLTTGQERMPRLGPERVRPSGRDIEPPESADTIGCLAFSPDGSVLAGATHPPGSSLAASTCGTSPGARSCAESRRIRGVGSLSFAPDGKTLASTGAEPVIRLWDVATGREALPQSGHRFGHPLTGHLAGRWDSLHRRR